MQTITDSIDAVTAVYTTVVSCCSIWPWKLYIAVVIRWFSDVVTW